MAYVSNFFLVHMYNFLSYYIFVAFIDVSSTFHNVTLVLEPQGSAVHHSTQKGTSKSEDTKTCFDTQYSFSCSVLQYSLEIGPNCNPARSWFV